MRVLKQFFALTFLTFLLPVANNALAQSAQMRAFCEEKMAETEINFTSSFGKLQYDTTKPYSFLQKEHRKKNKYTTGKVMGLSLQDATFKLNISIGSYTRGNQGCVVPYKVDIFFGYENPIIYVARETLSNKCKYEQVLRHEQTHQQINIKALEYFLPQMKKLMVKHIREMKPIYINKDVPERPLNTIQDSITDRITDLADQFQNFIKEEQLKLDNEKNYEFESTICGRF